MSEGTKTGNLRLVSHRTLSGLTQKGLAKRIGISNVTYCRVEKQVQILSRKRMEQIADVLEVDICDIFSLDELRWAYRGKPLIQPDNKYKQPQEA